MYARPASASRSSGSSRRSSAHAITVAIGSSSGCAGIGRSISCACPPSRWGGMTSRRATALATLLPWSRRTMCRHRSIPAALPADVSTRAVVDVEHVGVDAAPRDAGRRAWPRSASASPPPRRRAGPWRRSGRPRCRSRPAARRASCAARTASTTSRRRLAVPAGHDDRVGVLERLEPVLDEEREPAGRGRRGPGVSAATRRSYHHGTSSSGRSSPKTSTTQPSSNGAMPGAVRATTRCDVARS